MRESARKWERDMYREREKALERTRKTKRNRTNHKKIEVGRERDR